MMRQFPYLRVHTLVSLALVVIAPAFGWLSASHAEQSRVASANGAKPLSETELLQRLGMRLFMDTRLSNPPGQSCMNCHHPRWGFTDRDRSFPTSKGAVVGRFGNRNTPTLLYAALTPSRTQRQNAGELETIGGHFHDGRAANLEEQAGGPFLNPVEMNNPDKRTVVEKLKGLYAKEFVALFGADVFASVDTAFIRMTEAIAAGERLPGFRPFSSKFDAYLNQQTQLTEQELRGLAIFQNPDKGNCASCHTSQPGPNGEPPLFTNFTYVNLGVPPNPKNPFYRLDTTLNPLGEQFVDQGLAATTGEAKDRGKFKVPTLRNIAAMAPYMHNGYFESLKSAIEFHASRDTRVPCVGWRVSEQDAQLANCWPAAEVPENVDRSRVGQQRLSEQEIDDIIAFLHALTEGWQGT